MTCCLQAQLLSCCLGFADHDSVTVMMIPNDLDGQNDLELENNFKSQLEVPSHWHWQVSPRLAGDCHGRGRKPAFKFVTHDNHEAQASSSLCEVQVQFRVSPSHGQPRCR